jgi:methyltransferase
MHPRNIYNNLPDFNELSKIYKEFAEIAKVEISGKIRLDFSDLKTKFILTKCCLHKDFKLDVDLPENRLCPTLPLRLNYIHFIEDLFEYCNIKEDITGVDIGTGASSIYCLLAARINNWKMYGLEIDEENIKSANQNILKNELTQIIKIINQENSEKMFEKLFDYDPSVKTFCICNPPFYSDDREMTEIQNRTGKRPKVQREEKPSHETVTEGKF